MWKRLCSPSVWLWSQSWSQGVGVGEEVKELSNERWFWLGGESPVVGSIQAEDGGLPGTQGKSPSLGRGGVGAEGD